MEFTFVQKTKMLAGAGAVSQMGGLLAEAGYRKPFIVIDGFIRSSGTVDLEKIGLREHQIDYVVYDKVIPDPPAEHIDEGAAICRENGCDCVIAIGGGSCIDTAKGINILRFNEGSILDYAACSEKMKVSPGLISVPTTSGTGSELSDGVIVTDTKNQAKVPILAVRAMSEYAVIDPALTLGVPKKLTISTGLDVFSHAFEGYTSTKADILCDAVEEKIMQMVVENLPAAAEHPDDLEARKQMSAAASMAGWMLGNASTHIGHSTAHVLGAKLHMVHGEACAYALPGVMELISDVQAQKVKKAGIMLGAEFKGDEDAEQIGRITAGAYRRFRDEVLGLHPVQDYHADPAVVDACVKEIVHEPFMQNLPKKVTEDEIRTLVIKALGL